MGCVASKLEEEEVVFICRERKRQLKLAVERRFVLAEAHSRYCLALYAVAAAIRLFVARHSSPSCPFLITFPPPCPASPPPPENTISTNPLFLQQRPSESTQETIACPSPDSSTSSSKEEEEEEEEEDEEKGKEETRDTKQEQVCGYFYMQMPPPMHSPGRDFGWDFFNPFDGVRPEVINGYRYSPCSDDDNLRAVREEEGIPDLEEEGDRREEEKVAAVEENGSEECEESRVEVVRVVMDGANVSQGEQRGPIVIHNPATGREMLEALKDIEYHFIRAYDSGKDVSRMLEANRVHLQSGLGEIKENSTKLIQAITWHRSTSSRSSSCKSLVATGSKNSAWKEYKNDIFDDHGGMVSGSHSLTLGRLYAWEKKLYEEVKAGDSMRKIYERRCSQLRNQDVRGDVLNMDKTRAAVKDLHARILVTIRSAESISKRIEKLRDEELQPQIVELLQGLMRTWKIMLESHETQSRILAEVNAFACPTSGKFCNDSHRLATLQLEAELQNWHACFTEYTAAQKAYIEAIYGWLSKFVVPEVESYSRGRSEAVSYRANGPLLLVICHDWLASLEKLPEKTVACAMKSFAKDVRALWLHQGEEQQQKRKVDTLAKELDRRILGFQKAEKKVLESSISKPKLDTDAPDYLTEKKDLLDVFTMKLDAEKAKHHNCTQETQRVMLDGFQMGFSMIFESLTDFSKASLKMYNDLVTSFSDTTQEVGNPSYIEGSQIDEGSNK
ncbi:protein ALTERED PHOSPHATE STARVATION RESPONSE 1-like [Malania oleifera]|uniref:protein ALTERED PHOSPHATE STARVATION RESPONSE 1-like n=1 Tax=Malania oleifera TaxID=397392 RepID=UPI0025AE2929|nr:protein ALTERED PHOSPHATE STARVATION RESPONSE 1-like [Malania oleifera]